MNSSAQKQISLRPQDVVVVVKLVLNGERHMTYSEMARNLVLSASQVFASIKRAQIARLVSVSSAQEISPIAPAIREFLLHGVKYTFPAVLGPTTRGLPTSYSAEPLATKFASSESPLVWPYSEGDVRGSALYPLYPTVPQAARADRPLYEVLALIDAVRSGAAREREMAVELLNERIR